ncbi:hypothetical protein AX14_009601, partial [Amanita brunnescens Koide BX004]
MHTKCSRAPVVLQRSGVSSPSQSPDKSAREPKQLSSAIKVAGCPAGDPIVLSERLLKRSINVARLSDQQVPCSAFLGEMGEGRRGYGPVVNKVDGVVMTLCSPGIPTAVIPPVPSSPRSLFNKPVLCLEMMVQQRAPDIMVNEDVGAKIMQCLPDAVVALEQPVPASPEPKSTVEFRRSLGKRLPPVEEACEQLDVSAVSAKLQAGVGCSPAMETVQPQSPSLVVPVVGQLARAAAYIRECVNRRIPLREEFVRRAPKGPPDRTEAIRQPGLKVVNEEGGVNGSFRSPEGLAALALPIDYSPALPLQAIIPCPLLDGLAPLVGIARRQRGLVVVKTDCSAGIECTPTLEAAQRQFIPFLVLSRGREGGQLASAAKYIRERINERSPVCEEFGCRAPREPPDKVA